MNSLIKETNDNLKAIIDTLKGNLDASVNTLDSIQMQMDKKVEEAKKYKIQVDSAKESIKELENDNKSLELSLKELNDKYGKMNLVSVIEAGNREIKSKINDNVREINRLKEQIAELTSKARTIKDLLMNLKKDKTSKENRLDNLKVVYEYYNTRINDVIDYAFKHSDNLVDYMDYSYINNEYIDNVEVSSGDIENTMVFDEIANIDDNKNFKDEMSFIDEQIDKNIDYKTLNNEEYIDNNVTDNTMFVNENDDSDVFNSILETEDKIEEEAYKPLSLEEAINQKYAELTGDNSKDNDISELESSLNSSFENNELNVEEEPAEELELFKEEEAEEVKPNPFASDLTPEIDVLDTNLSVDSLPIFDVEDNKNDNEPEEEIQEEVLVDELLDKENEDRINKINNLFSTLNDIKIDSNDTSEVPLSNGLNPVIPSVGDNIMTEPLMGAAPVVDPTMVDIFGNPIHSEEINQEVVGKSIEELFTENGVDFNKFKDDEKKYLKQIYEQEKFEHILSALKRNKINIDNIYSAFNIFGECSPNELESIITKLLDIGQSAEAIGAILEKLPKILKYNLDEAIISYGDYIKNIDITELVMKAKEISKNGGNL